MPDTSFPVQKLDKHTPGPWEIAQYKNWMGFSIWGPGAGCIAERWYASEHEDAPILANANLIAAAPDMLEVLETIENDGKQVPDWLWQRIQAVVRKAKGI